MSDANLVLGYLPPVLLGGDMALDVAAAKAAIAKIGQAIGLSPEDAAKGIIDIANEVMLGALRVITVQRGLDPRDFGIVAFGGAGPLHANALAELLGCYPVLVPPSPGVLSALGFLEAEFKNEFVQTFHPIDRRPRLREKSGRRFAALAKKRRRGWTSRKSTKATAAIGYSLDLRYEQQGFEVTIEAAGRARRQHRDRSTKSSTASTIRISGSMVSASTFRSNWSRCASLRPGRRPRLTRRLPSDRTSTIWQAR